MAEGSNVWQTRGLGKDECRKIILHGFADEILFKINNDKLKNKIQEKITQWIRYVN